jgi:AcrR family transcriptional regulator
VPRRGLTRSQIVEEAAQLADEVGLEQVSFATLAKRLGVSAPALYKHIDGLDQLNRDLTILGLTELWLRVREAATGMSGRDALFAVARTYRQYAHERPGLVGVVLRAPDPSDDEHEAVTVAALSTLQQVFSGYRLSADDTVHAIRALRVIMHGFVSLETAGGFGLSQSLDETYDRLIDALDSSLADRSTSLG